ncbi:unnamed protein product [Leptidea sinapis]|uniref:Uncharacterized protein n=1 Tax=Leptidea sinapis TaxID=189913 RepID=A0A5E4Q462_9NEOP|nr:unnamed protein product [Leptidea sinapis]
MSRVVLCLLALCVASGISDPVEHNATPPTIADANFLQKQIDLLTLYFHVGEPLQDRNLKSIAESWNIERNIEKYNKFTRN